MSGSNTSIWQELGFPSEETYREVTCWIEKEELNYYGDPQDMMYAGGNPLFYSRKALYEYILENHPNKPWEGLG